MPDTTVTTDLRTPFLTGVRGVAPILLGIVPFGLVAGLASVEADLGVVGAIAFSTFVFAGASQLAAIELVASGAPAVVAIGTALVINLRMLMYSASLAPHLADLPRGTRLRASYLLTDQAYAVSIMEFRRGTYSTRARLAIYLGAGLSLWTTWQVSTVVGALGGGAVPDGIPLGFAVPLAFLSLLVPAMTDRATVVAAVVGGVVATVGVDLPSNLGMPLGALAGVVAGWLVARSDVEPGASESPRPAAADATTDTDDHDETTGP